MRRLTELRGLWRSRPKSFESELHFPARARWIAAALLNTALFYILTPVVE